MKKLLIVLSVIVSATVAGVLLSICIKPENRLFYKNVEALSQYEYVKIPCAEARNLNCSFTARFADGTFHSVTVPDHIFAGYF